MTNDEKELAAAGELSDLLDSLGEGLDSYLRFEDEDAMQNPGQWQQALRKGLPITGIGVQNVVDEIKRHVLPNASAVPKPGFSSFITTGAVTSAVLATLSGAVASPQRYGLTAFNFLEELSLDWLVQLLGLPEEMKGVYSSGGSVANIVALGAARQCAFERIGIDPSLDGMQLPSRIYASAACHHTIHRAAAVLGMGRASVIPIAVDAKGRMNPDALRKQIDIDANDSNSVKVAIVANAGSTDTGAVDPLSEIGAIAKKHNIWFHIDGAYGLPGVLDPNCSGLYSGVALANSVSIDPHKWLGAPVGIGATFVRDRDILHRAFTQETAHYLEGAFSDDEAQNSMDRLGIPYADFGLELSAPSRGVVVWALIREIGKHGLAQRVIRHNGMAKHIAERAKQHEHLELLLEPTLSICCFRFNHPNILDLDDFNRRIHRQLVHNGQNIPSTTMVHDCLVIRPCFVGARAEWHHADDLVDEVLDIGNALLTNSNWL